MIYIRATFVYCEYSGSGNKMYNNVPSLKAKPSRTVGLPKALEALLKLPAIRGLTESLTNLIPIEWRTILAKLRRARLLAGEDPHNPGQLDAHPLVREYFGEQLRSQRSEAWKECNKRLFHHYERLHRSCRIVSGRWSH